MRSRGYYAARESPAVHGGDEARIVSSAEPTLLAAKPPDAPAFRPGRLHLSLKRSQPPPHLRDGLRGDGKVETDEGTRFRVVGEKPN